MFIENRRRTGKKVILICAVFLIALLQFPLLGLSGTAHADGGLQITATYPEVTVKAGSDYTFFTKVKNDTGAAQTVNLSATVPDGWTYILQGGGNRIYKAYVDNGSSTDANLTVTIPATAESKSYQVTLTANGDNGVAASLTLNLDVTKGETKQGKWTTDTDTFDGSNTDTFKYSTNITNNSEVAQTYSLSSNAPDGWDVEFDSASTSQQIASCGVSPEGSQGVEISIIPSYNTLPGSYKVTCTAKSPNETMTLDLKLNVTGSYSMILTTPSGALNADAYAESDTPVVIEIQNNGASDLKNVQLSASAPTGWTVKLDKTSISSIPAGEKQDVTAYIKASTGSIVADYPVDFSATASGASAQTTFRVAFKAPVVWGYVGLIIILLLIAGLIGVFMKFGRR